MEKQTTVKDVAKGNANLTDVRFCIVKEMLDVDQSLRNRVLAYLKWYHVEHRCTAMGIGSFSISPLCTHCTTPFNNNDILQILIAFTIVLTACLIIYAYTLYIKIRKVQKK